MDRDDEYRKRAAEAQEFAELAVSESDKAAWLEVAKGWRSLIRRPGRPAQDETKE